MGHDGFPHFSTRGVSTRSKTACLLDMQELCLQAGEPVTATCTCVCLLPLDAQAVRRRSWDMLALSCFSFLPGQVTSFLLLLSSLHYGVQGVRALVVT